MTKKKKISLTTSSFDNKNSDIEIDENNLSSDSDYLPLKYPNDEKYNQFIKNFSINTQDKKNAGSSRNQTEDKYCGNCSVLFNKKSYSAKCVSCEKWHCLSCTGLSKKEILDVKKNKSGWNCVNCLKPLQNYNVSQTETLKEENNMLRRFILEISQKMEFLLTKMEKLEELHNAGNFDQMYKNTGMILNLIKENKPIQPQNNMNSYANTLKPPVDCPKIKQNIPVVVIKPKSKQHAKETRICVQKQVNPVSVRASIDGIKEIKNGGIIIKSKSKDDVKKLVELSKEKLGNKYSVYTSKLKVPRLVLIGSREPYKTEELLEELRNLDYINKNDSLKVVFTRQSKYSKRYIIYIETKGETFQKLVNQEISLGWDKCKFQEDLNITICYKCSGYGHKIKDCAKNQVCSFCSGHHKYWNCKEEHPFCNNCNIYNEKYNLKYCCNHEALTLQFTIHQKKILEAKEKIDYHFNEEV